VPTVGGRRTSTTLVESTVRTVCGVSTEKKVVLLPK
jgi:hypothetical protein